MTSVISERYGLYKFIDSEMLKKYTMKQFVFTFLMQFIVCLVPVVAQNDTTGWGRNSAYNRMYNSATAVEIEGEIVAVENTVPIRGMSAGIHLMINTGSETISVHLGPKWYLDRQNIKFKKGDKVNVEGSRVMLDAQSVVIAREVKTGGQLLTLRDKNGMPKWSGRRFRN